MPIDINHPLIAASRYADAQAEELGLMGAIESNKIDAQTLLYAAQQRALRMVLLVSRGEQALVSLSQTEKTGIELKPFEQSMMEQFTITYLDGMFIGWKAAIIDERDERS